jgi:replicative DNA helicase
MKVKKFETPERLILTGMIVSNEAIMEIHEIYKSTFFQSRWTREVASWCIDYYRKYEKAPNKHIKDIYEDKTKDMDETTASAIGDFLEGISNEYGRNETFNAQYISDLTEQYFQANQMEQLCQEVRQRIKNGEQQAALSFIRNFDSVKRKKSEGVSIYDDDIIEEIFSEEGDPNELFQPNGAVGEVLGSMKRKRLIAFVAPAKRGKSWWIQEICLQGHLKGFNAAIFTLEMEEEEVVTRIASNLTASPIGSESRRILLPVFDCERNQNGSCNLTRDNSEILVLEGEEKPSWQDSNQDYRACTNCIGSKEYVSETWWKPKDIKSSSLMRAKRKMKAIRRMVKGEMKVCYLPPDITTVDDIKGALAEWEKEGFVPDIIGVDYADLLNSSEKLEYRHRLDSVWKSLKRLAQDKSCLVVTASQAGKEAFSKKIKEKHVAEDYRKLAHVDQMIGLNQTEEEKEAGVMNVQIILQRHGNSNLGATNAIVLQNHEIGKTCIDSIVLKRK